MTGSVKLYAVINVSLVKVTECVMHAVLKFHYSYDLA